MKGYIYTKQVGEDVYVGSTFNLKVRAQGHKAVLDVIEDVEVENRTQLVCIENYWIEQFRQWGFKLQNRLANISYIKNSKPPLPSKGKNVRFSNNGYRVLSKFCKRNGYKLGAFCSIAALEKMKNESTNNL